MRLKFILGHVMESTAFITYPLSFAVHSDGIKSAQDAAAFRTDPDNRLKTISAEDIF
jgi:hypothetical protein